MDARIEQPPTPRPDRRSFLGLAGAGLGALGLAACSSDTAANGSGDAASSDTTAASSADPAALAPGSTQAAASDLDQSGYIWTGARMLWVTTTFTDVEAATDQIPPNLELAEPHKASYFVAVYPLTNFGSVYNEAAYFIHVNGPEGPGMHCPWMVVDDDTALVYGRELLGFPKKMAEITMVEGEDSIVGTVVRKGAEVLRLEAKTRDLTPAEGPVFGATSIYNAHGSVVGGMRLLHIPPLPEAVHERSTGPGTVQAASTDRDRIAAIDPAGNGEATSAVLDFAEFSPAFALPIEDIAPDWAFEKTMQRAL